MPRLDNIFQTVADRDNPDDVAAQGPFLCVNKPWLGRGYYFWDNLMTRAHWWGKKHYNGQYIICQASANIDDDKYLDLAGNMEQLKYFEQCCSALRENYHQEHITVSLVIAKLIRSGIFPYQAIRVLSESCGGDEKMLFVDYSKSFLNFSPPMQICIFEKSRIEDYHIVYPVKYMLEGFI